MKKISHYIYFGAFCLLFCPKQVFGATTVGDLFENIDENLRSTDVLLQVVCYIGGLTLGAIGVVDIKKHLDNPGNVPLSNPLTKLLVAAFLISLPTVISIIIDSTVGHEGSLNIINMDLGTGNTPSGTSGHTGF